VKRNPASSISPLSSPWLFFVFVLGWTWLFWIPTALSGTGVGTPIATSGFVLGGLGPPLGGIAFTYLTQGKEGRRDYWLRIVDPRRINARWYLVVLLFAPVLTALAALLDILCGGSGATLEEAAVRFLSAPLAIIPFALYLFFVGPFAEELGWRGYVLDRLQARWNALSSSLILGIVWAFWHLPLFFIRGTYQYDLRAGSLSFWLLMIDLIPGAILQTWVFNNTRRSTLAAILLHFMGNFTGELIASSKRMDLFATLMWIVAAIVVTAIWGSRSLTRNRQRRPTTR
jgi:membrane protease YdiL (CAAX protease family)